MYSFYRPIILIVLLTFLFVTALSCGESSGDDLVSEPSKSDDVIASLPDKTPEIDTSHNLARQPDDLAPELVGLDGWLNTEPFRLEEKRGNVILVDFWTYTCVNCIRTLPYLKQWHKKYSDQGLIILGVHAPEFEFEKIAENVKMARDQYSIEYPIVQDNDLKTWAAFENQFWPAKYLIDKNGVIRYKHFGEGAYIETEKEIRKLLLDAGSDLTSISISNLQEPERDEKAWNRSDPESSQTRELYAGFLRNFGLLRSGSPPYVMHEDFYADVDQEVFYKDPLEYRNHHIYLQGNWINRMEELVHARSTENHEDYMVIKFNAIEVNVVLAMNDKPYKLRVWLDGKPVDSNEAGTDIAFDQFGNSIVNVNRSDMYNLIKLPRYSSHELKISSNSDELAIFAFTFGSYITEPNVNR